MELLVHAILVVKLDPISLLSFYFIFLFFLKSALKTNMHLLIRKKKKKKNPLQVLCSLRGNNLSQELVGEKV